MQRTLIFMFAFSVISVADEMKSNLSSVFLDGYDVVAYFRNNWPCRGKIEYSYGYMGSTWYFSSQKNMELFRKNPERFVPMYNGFNSAEISKIKFSKANPIYFLIRECKLFLFSNKTELSLWKNNFPKEFNKAEKGWSSYVLAKK